MKSVELFSLLLVIVVILVQLGKRLAVPYPIILVIGGLVLSLIPGLPHVHLDPDVIFFIVLPPLLYEAGCHTSWHEFKAILRPVFFLAVILVALSAALVAMVAHAVIPGLSLAAAFALGAIVSPPDAVAASAIAQRLKLPKRVTAILEGESLVNDATGLVILRFALAAAATGAFSLPVATLEFILLAAGGTLVGCLVGLLMMYIWQRIEEDALTITLSLLTPYIAYLLAERIHVSGVLAAVSAGIYLGWKSPEILSAKARLQGNAVWDMLVFLLNSFVFILMGLQMPDVIKNLGDYKIRDLVFYAVIISATLILARPMCIFPTFYISRMFGKRSRKNASMPSWKDITILSWSGMRGVVSLAAALALPMTFTNETSFHGRNLIIFLTFCTILATLVLQGLTLPLIVRLLGLKPSKESSQAERHARLKLAHAALSKIEQVAETGHFNEKSVIQVTNIYRERILHLSDELAETLGWSPDRERAVYARLLHAEGLLAERQELIKLYKHHEISKELLHRIEREIDLEETKLRN